MATANEQEVKQQLQHDAVYPLWRWHLWESGFGSYEQIEAALAEGTLKAFTCPKSDCDCEWPKVELAAVQSNKPLPLKWDQESDLRLDYSVECEHCGYLKKIPPKWSEREAQRLLLDQGWRLIDDENHCPTCAEQDEHTPDEGEPHPAVECESRGCVKLRK